MSSFFCIIFIKLHLRFSDFVNSDNCIGIITSNSIRLYSVFTDKIYFYLNENVKVSSEKMRNHTICMILLSCSTEMVFNPNHYTG